MSFGPPRCRWAGIESRTRKLYGALVGPLLADSSQLWLALKSVPVCIS